MHSMNPAWEPQWAGMAGFRGRRGPTGRGRSGRDADLAMAAADDDDRHGRDERGPRRGGGRRSGPAFRGPGFGGPFGPFGPRGRGRRRTSRGDVRLAVLALVAEQPRHGYEIIQEIGARSDGRWRASPGSVYPTVAQLEDEGLVRTEQVEGRRIVHLTEEGGRYVEEHRAELDRVWQAGDVGDEAADDLQAQLGQLNAAAMQVMSAGTDEQIRAATSAITEARKAIYRLLAE
jgi:DNA-binding PadR family transcriptional regulator